MGARRCSADATSLAVVPTSVAVLVWVGHPRTRIRRVHGSCCLRAVVQMVEKREAERRQLDERKRKEELEFLRHQGKHLDLFLKQMSSGK